MTHSSRLRTGLTALAAATAVLLVGGCTTQPGVVPKPGTTAQRAMANRFTCPPMTEVAALAAVPFTAGKVGNTACTYSTAADADVSTVVTVSHPSPAANRRTLTALRYAAVRRGAETADAPRLALDAFTVTTKQDCTTWFTAGDGVVTSVAARTRGARGSASCTLSTTVATLAGTGAPRPAAPIVSVLAARRLLGTTTEDGSWPWRIGRDGGVRIVRTAASGYLRPSSSSSLARAATMIPASSAAVVFVTGTAEAGSSRIAILSDATAAFSAAASRAPHAKLIVVGPLFDGSQSPEAVSALRLDLQTAATIAEARFMNPADRGLGARAALDAVADQVSSALRSEGLLAR